LAFITFEPYDPEQKEPSSYTYFYWYHFVIANKVTVIIQFGILKIIPALIAVITSFAGIMAAWRRQLHLARIYFTGLILLISTNIVLLLFSLISMNLERIQLFGGEFVMVSLIMVIILVCGLVFGLLCNSPCLCCLYCGRQYQYALWDLQDYENPASNNAQGEDGHQQHNNSDDDHSDDEPDVEDPHDHEAAAATNRTRVGRSSAPSAASLLGSIATA